MKAAPLLVQWHNDHAPIYSVHFEPQGRGRLATSGGDNNVRIWKVASEGEERKITYLSTLTKHTQAVNVVRFAPKGEVLATAGDDGNTLLWVPSETLAPAFGDEGLEDKESWRVKHMCRSGYEIYDLAWSPDASYFIIGSIDNIARIYNASNGSMVRQIAEHNHYVQGVTWDPLNEYVATQSSDRSVHIYNLRTKDGKFTLDSYSKVSKMDLPGKVVHGQTQSSGDLQKVSIQAGDPLPASPAPSASIPGTPTSFALLMNPPTFTHSRRSSFASSPSHRRSASPAPSMPLPAVRPMENSPLPFTALGSGYKNSNIYANETYSSFFRRLTFAPDGSLLFTPAGQYKISKPHPTDTSKVSEDMINTVYIYTRAGLNKPPVTHLPGHKKPSIAVKCSPIFYTQRQGTKPTVQITLDTSSADEAIPALPDPMVPTSIPSTMDPPRSTSMIPSKDTGRPNSSHRDSQTDVESVGPIPVFALPYRIVYAVATQDSILVYDTQQQTPLCVVSNLHFTTFTDLTWSSDGLTLLMSSSDGFCSTITFTPGELGSVYTGAVPHATLNNYLSNGPSQSAQPSPIPTPTGSIAPSISRLSNTGAFVSPNPHNPGVSPTKSRSNSVSSVATQSSFAPPPSTSAIIGNSPTPIMGTVPSVTASNAGSLLLSTPPATPMSVASLPVGTSVGSLGKRDSISTIDADEEERQPKKRRIAPTPINGDNKS